jgi:DNA-binding response OmpR family regulator
MYLESRGFQVIIASTALAARATLHRLRPQLVVTDLHLPDESGREVARAPRAVGARVLALTGDSAPIGPFDRVLQKPCPPRVIVSAVERLMQDDLPRVASTD